MSPPISLMITSGPVGFGSTHQHRRTGFTDDRATCVARSSAGALPAEKPDEPVQCGLIQQQLVSAAVGSRLHVDAQRSADGVFEGCRGCNVVGVRAGSRPLGTLGCARFQPRGCGRTNSG